MNYSIAMFALLMMAGGHMKSFSTFGSNEKEEVSNEIKSDDSKKVEEKMAIVEINALRGKYTVQIGQQLRYSAGVHGSVGYSASAGSSDSEALPLVESFIEYDDEERAQMSGGDSATKYFIFDVKKAGVYEIHARHYFRGDLEHDYTITITVEE